MTEKLDDLQRQWDERTRQNLSQLPHLKHGGGGGTFDGMDVIDAKIAAAEARTDTKFAEVIGELKAMRTELAHMPSTWTMVGTIGAFTAAASGLLIAVLALSSQMLGIGMDAQQVSERSASSAIERVQPQIDTLNANYVGMNSKLDQVLTAIGNTKLPNDVDAPRQFAPVPFENPKP